MLFFLYKGTSSPHFHTVKFICSPGGGLSLALPISKPLCSGSSTFFQIQGPLGLVQNWVWFHVHTTYSPMLEIIWVQSFTTN
jgi:hypothetical protein